MRAATISRRYVEPDRIDEVLCVRDDVPCPPKPNEGQLLRVLACSLAPGRRQVGTHEEYLGGLVGPTCNLTSANQGRHLEASYSCRRNISQRLIL